MSKGKLFHVVKEVLYMDLSVLSHPGSSNSVLFLNLRSYVGRVEMLRRKKLELRASRSAVAAKNTEVTRKDSIHDDSSSDDEDNENIKVDWRAKHL